MVKLLLFKGIFGWLLGFLEVAVKLAVLGEVGTGIDTLSHEQYLRM